MRIHFFLLVTNLIAIPVGHLFSEEVHVALAAQTEGMLGLPMYSNYDEETETDSTRRVRFVVVVTNEGQSSIYFYSPHHSQGADLIFFEVRDNIETRSVERTGMWIRSLPNQIFELTPHESVFFPIVLPSSDWSEFSCTPIDSLRVGFRYFKTTQRESAMTAFSRWYRAENLMFGLGMKK